MESYTMPCGCLILYDLTNVGDYGYGGEIVDRWQIETARIEDTCVEHQSFGGVQ